jgi:hypothetical protein
MSFIFRRGAEKRKLMNDYRIYCTANQINTNFLDEMNIVGVAGICGSGSKFIVASIIVLLEVWHVHFAPHTILRPVRGKGL